MRVITGLLLCLVLSLQGVAASTPGPKERLSVERLEQLSSISFHPALLPIILKNRDFIGLTDSQVEVFRTWQRENAKKMIAEMNEIISKRAYFRRAAITPSVSADALRALQQEIFRLQMRVLNYRLTCRENMLKTFNKDNWAAFLIVLADEGYAIPDDAEHIASLKFSHTQNNQ